MSDPNQPGIPPQFMAGVQPLFPPNKPPTLTATASPPGWPHRRGLIRLGEVVGEVGRAGVAVLIRERCRRPIRLVGLDFLLARPLAGAEGWLSFLEDARALTHLLHPDIVPIYEAGVYSGQACFSVTLVEGSLARPWTETARSPEVALALGRLAQAIYDAGRHAVSRKSLRPARIALDSGLAPDTAQPGWPGQGEQRVILNECLANWPPYRPGSREPTAPAPRSAGREILQLKCPSTPAGRRFASADELASEFAHWLMKEFLPG